jgi:hypothetical protein
VQLEMESTAVFFYLCSCHWLNLDRIKWNLLFVQVFDRGDIQEASDCVQLPKGHQGILHAPER